MSAPADERGGQENPLQDATWLYSYADLMTQLLIFAILMLTVVGISAAPSPSATETAAGQQPDELGSAVAALDRTVADLGLGSSVAVEQAADRVVIRMKSRLLFDEGQASLTSEAERVLADVTKVLAGMPNQVRVEGHTDNLPVRSGRFPSNWELSSARAISVTQVLERGGVPRARLSVAGHGEYRPMVPNDDEEHRALNRRVEIVILGERP